MQGNSLETVCGCVVGGAGPAGMGLLFNALKRGLLPELTKDGLIIIDASDEPGSGRLGDYRITANSVGDVFLDCLRDPALQAVFKPLEQSATLWRIRHQAQSAPPLGEVGQLLAEASRLVLEYIVREYDARLWRSTRITGVSEGDDHYLVQVEHGGNSHTVCCRTLVLNLGGRQDPAQLRSLLAAQGLDLPIEVPVHSGDALLRMSPVQLRELFAPTLARKGRITVVGGSHSAFSVLENLADALEFPGLKEVTLVHRSPVRLFYENAEQAREAGYAFDPVLDVCPVSGRINRSGGLRYRALEIGREALRHGHIGKTGVRLLMLQTEEGAPEDAAHAAQALAESDAVIQCTGYQPCLPPMWDPQGLPLALRELKGGIDSDPSGCPLEHDGRRLHGLHLFGLGSGLGIDPRLGSEPSFEGRIYGVWQFHNDASGAVLDAVLVRLADMSRADTQRAPLFTRIEQHLPMLWPRLLGAES